jgi:hypothetical protein
MAALFEVKPAGEVCIMNIVLKGGPLDGETDRVSEDSRFYYRFAKGPDARYRATEADDNSGRRIFEHFPPKPGQPEPTEGVHEA